MTFLPWISVTLLELVSFLVEKEIAGVQNRPGMGSLTPVPRKGAEMDVLGTGKGA